METFTKKASDNFILPTKSLINRWIEVEENYKICEFKNSKTVTKFNALK